jgi:hypothetical protein
VDAPIAFQLPPPRLVQHISFLEDAKIGHMPLP